MTPKQLFELLKYIMENNSWANMYETHKRNRIAIKYTDFSFDSRTGDVWFIKFRAYGGHEGKTFKIENQADIDRIYKWLDKPLRECKKEREGK